MVGEGRPGRPQRRVAFAAHVIAGLSGADASSEWTTAHLAAAFWDGRAPEADPFIVKYAGAITVTLSIDELIMPAPLSREALGIALIGQHLASGDADAAWQVAHALPDTPLGRLARGVVALEMSQPDRTVLLTDGAPGNTDDVTAFTLAVRASALRQNGHPHAAIEAARAAMSAAGRSPGVLLRARFERGLAYAAAGKAGMARNDLEKVYATDSTFRDVANHLSET